MRSLLCVLVLAAAACTANKPDRLSVGHLLIQLPPGQDALRGHLRAGVEEVLTKTKRLDYTPGGSDFDSVVEVRLDMRTDPDSGATDAMMLIEVRDTQGVGRFLARETWSEDSEPHAESVLGAFRRSWNVVQEQRTLQKAAIGELMDAARNGVTQVRLYGIRQLGKRDSSDARALLRSFLDEGEEPQVALAAIGALIQLRDQEAVPPMIELARRKDPNFVLQIAYALGAIGGSTAEGYLVTLASGHPDPRVRQGAEDALKELTVRSK